MMQMLAAGGLPVLSDGVRAADVNNQRGYYEWERIKTLAQDPGCMSEAHGHGLKVISSLLPLLPQQHSYRVVFLVRPLEEVAASQAEMIRTLQAGGPALERAIVLRALDAHLRQTRAWLNQQAWLPALFLDYHAVLQEPKACSMRVQEFLGSPLDVDRMASQVDLSQWRQRSL